MSTHPKTSAKGRYRQFRVTATQEANGRVSFSAYAKPMGAEWHERQCILRSSTQYGVALNTTEDVLYALIRVIEEQLLDLQGVLEPVACRRCHEWCLYCGPLDD